VLHKSSAATAREAKWRPARRHQPRTRSISGAPARPGCVSIRSGGGLYRFPLGKVFAPGPIIPLSTLHDVALVRARSVRSVREQSFPTPAAKVTVDHLEAMQSQYGARHFMFVDEILTLKTFYATSPRRSVARGMDIYWYGETRFARGIDQSLADLLYASGCRRLTLGSKVHQRVLD